MAAVAARMECSVVVVGDAKIGKTALIRRLTKNEFTEVGSHFPLMDRLMSSLISFLRIS